MNYDKKYFKRHFSGKGFAGPFYRKYIDMRNKIIKKEVLKIINEGKFLDIGFGDDNLIKFFQDSFEVFGIDISKYAIKEIKKKYKKENFKICDLSKEKIPFEEKFNIISAINTIEHLRNLKSVFERIYEALEDNGIFVVYLPTQSNKFSKIQYKLLYNVKEHTFRPSNEKLKKMLEKAGLRLKKEYSGDFFPIKIKNKHIIDSFNLYFGIFQK